MVNRTSDYVAVDRQSVEDEIKELPETVTIVYTDTPGYKVIYVNGIYGGLTGKDEIRFDLFQEFKPAPDKEVYEVTKGGRMGNIISDNEEVQTLQLIREKQVGVIMPISFARVLHSWLGDKLETYEQIETKLPED